MDGSRPVYRASWQGGVYMKGSKATHQPQQEARGWGAHGNVPERVCPASFADRILEGKAGMSSIHKQKTRREKSARRIVALSILTAFVTVNLCAQTPQNVPDVTALSVEDLMNMQV